MAILKWNTRTVDERKIDRHPANYDGHGDNVVRADSLYGEQMFKPYDREGIEPAGRYNGFALTAAEEAEYVKKTPPRSPKRDRHCPGNDDTCMGWARHDTGYCFGHSVSMGLKPPPNISAETHQSRSKANPEQEVNE